MSEAIEMALAGIHNALHLLDLCEADGGDVDEGTRKFLAITLRNVAYFLMEAREGLAA